MCLINLLACVERESYDLELKPQFKWQRGNSNGKTEQALAVVFIESIKFKLMKFALDIDLLFVYILPSTKCSRSWFF